MVFWPIVHLEILKLNEQLKRNRETLLTVEIKWRFNCFFHYMNVCCIPPTPAVPIETFAWLKSEFFTWIRKRFSILYFKDQLFIWRYTSIIILFQLLLLFTYSLWIIFDVSNTDHICKSWVCHQAARFGLIELHFTAKKKDRFIHTQACQTIRNKMDKIGQKWTKLDKAGLNGPKFRLLYAKK